MTYFLSTLIFIGICLAIIYVPYFIGWGWCQISCSIPTTRFGVWLEGFCIMFSIALIMMVVFVSVMRIHEVVFVQGNFKILE
jgi:hypothetical protein